MMMWDEFDVVCYVTADPLYCDDDDAGLWS